MSFQEELVQKLKDYIRDRSFMRATGISPQAELEFLAQGEYNINYLIKDQEEKYVLRVNLGSQMNLDDQIGYEFSALEALAPSGVTPRPFFLDNSREKIDYGILLMEYLSGRPLDYQKDLKAAAKVLAKIHKLDVGRADRLIREEKPLTAIWNECSSLLDKYFDSELGKPEIKTFLKKMKADLAAKREKEVELMDIFPLSIVNTEVNSNNFIINDKFNLAYLVDWEKPLVTTPLQDLSHFMVPTTTLWKTNFIFNQGEEEEFLHHYLKERGRDSQYREVKSALKLFNQFSAMRGVSWSAMAWVEYQAADREIKNQDTFETMDSYLRLDFLEMLFPAVK
ncbi:phosphotransferase family enzyme [Halanaerobium saccharolyticum]|uniref:Phosphotransferase family enzyme n=1 Tax=Halanaerobium saccharolyticum TaxID=43595 RepID=A0A4R7Z8A4_9FIRM|nr:aminoglycoside phosphotransferase family protein [Halanaerobium saccharolyticum]RAK08632.1 phosphotransferase family enzyme [Halanaerobium saccharolyticum]TDW07225.1 phosphotransferase family enzyme [Halanaerobium saccharolyticum]TDX60184.1 phosphotransferase family enzyme [Halanaerobium saccharolyticum]